MQYPNNDLWTVRQSELLNGALEDMRHKSAIYYPNKTYSLAIPGIANYSFRGVLDFENDDRTIMFECGDGFGLTRAEITQALSNFQIKYTEISD